MVRHVVWAVLALALITLAGLQFGYALTLAGVAGLVISLGVTRDSYIVFFERLKDEVRGGQERSHRGAAGVRPLVQDDRRRRRGRGHRRRRPVPHGRELVRGFALTLGVATLLDLFVVYFFKRPTVFLLARNQRLVSLKGFGLEAGVAGEASPGDEPTGRRS